MHTYNIHAAKTQLSRLVDEISVAANRSSSRRPARRS